MLHGTCARGAAIAGAILFAASASAGMTNFFANLSGDNENPPTGSGATGTFSGVYDSVANTFSFEWSIVDLEGTPSSPGSHIHVGPPDMNGPIVFPFHNPDFSWPLVGSAVWTNLSQQNIDDLFAGLLYANFHTNLHPSGELRGQILIPAPGGVSVLALAGLVTMRRRR